MLERLKAPFQLGLRPALADIVLVGNSFVWYYVVLVLFLEKVVPIDLGLSQSIIIWGLHFGGLIFSAFLGIFISKKIGQKQFITLWMILGTIASLAIILVNPSDIAQVGLIGLLIGAALGLGMPACIGRFADSIPVERRGRVGGITLFVSGIGIVAFSLLGITGIIILGVVLAVWRLLGLVIFLLANVPSPIAAKKSAPEYKKIISQYSFLLYFAPWVMFSLINYLVAPTGQGVSSADMANVALVQTGFIGLFALLGGFFIDSMGRKRVAVVGFILLGLGTALLGINTTNLTILYLNAILDGTAFGFLFLLYILILWGDLSYSESSQKYYAIGVFPFFVSKFLSNTIGGTISSAFAPSSSGGSPGNSSPLFAFGAIFLFFAVLPLMYAPETLPEKSLKDRDLKSYVERANKAVLKNERKKQNEKNQKKTEVENEETDENFKEAQELAEKYY